MTFHSILWSLSNLHSTLVLRCIELKSDMDLPWGKWNHSHKWLLWQLCCRGNQSDTLVTSLS